LNGTITSEGGSLRDIDTCLVVYRASSTIGPLPVFIRFGEWGNISPKVWQSNTSGGGSVSKIYPDGQGWYKITKPYVFLQWLQETPNGVKWFEYKI